MQSPQVGPPLPHTHTHISQAFSQDGELGEQQKWRSRAQPSTGETKPRAPARPEDPRDGGGQPGPEVPSVQLVSLLRGKNPNLSLAHPRDWQGPGPHCHPGVSHHENRPPTSEEGRGPGRTQGSSEHRGQRGDS